MCLLLFKAIFSARSGRFLLMSWSEMKGNDPV